MNYSKLVVWFVFGLVFLGLLLDYAPTIGAGAAVLIMLYLALKIIPQLPQLARANQGNQGGAPIGGLE